MKLTQIGIRLNSEELKIITPILKRVLLVGDYDEVSIEQSPSKVVQVGMYKSNTLTRWQSFNNRDTLLGYCMALLQSDDYLLKLQHFTAMRFIRSECATGVIKLDYVKEVLVYNDDELITVVPVTHAIKEYQQGGFTSVSKAAKVEFTALGVD